MATSAYFEVRLDDDDEKSVEKSENRETVAPTGNLGQDFFIKITFFIRIFENFEAKNLTLGKRWHEVLSRT